MDELDFQSQPNDAYFKAVFSDLERATPLFRKRLPQELVTQIEWASLALEPASFVKQSLQQSHSNLLFSVKAGGERVMLYLLFEHQTSVDPAMPLRLLGYIVEILQQHQRRHGGPWPLVFPFVLNQGPDRWNVSENFEDGFAMGVALEGLLPYLPKFRYALLDLTELDPDSDEDHDELRLALQLMKLVRLRKQAEFLAWLERELSRPGLTLRLTLIRSSFVYLLHTDAVIDLEAIAVSLSHYPDLKEDIMTLADRLIAQGEARGEARGNWIGKIQVLEKLLGLPETEIAILHGLGIEMLEQRYVALEADYNSRFKRA